MISLFRNNALVLKTGLRSSKIENIKDWISIKDTVEAYRVDIVYSKYPLKNGKYEEIYPLLFNRLKNLFIADPNLNNFKITWNKILQTNCVDDKQVSGLFHGIVIWYHTEIEADTNLTKKDTIKTFANTNKIAFKYQTTILDIKKNVENIKSSNSFPDSLRKIIEGHPLDEQIELIKDFLEEKIRKEPNINLSKATKEELKRYNKEVDEFLSKYNTSDDVVSTVLSRHQEWENMVIVNDWTGSMYCYGAQVLKWHLLNFKKSGITFLTLFNDGDGKSDHEKIIGKTGGIYSENADNIQKLLDLFRLVMIKGGGGDSPENDIEAILTTIEKYPNCSNVLLIADHNSCVKDIELADRIKVPIKIILCGYNKTLPINPDYVYLAKKTNGGIYTIEDDIENLEVVLGEVGEIISSSDTRFSLRQFRCNSSNLRMYEDTLYKDFKKAEKKKLDVYQPELCGQNINTFPKAIYKMTNLYYLNLSNNNISEISSKINKLCYLKTLNLSYNQLKEIPNKIKEVLFIEDINFSHNKLTIFPVEILNMKNLISLDLSNNNIGFIGNNVNLKKLEFLNLSSNLIQELPKAFGQMKRLKILDLSNNDINVVPLCVMNLTKLKELMMENNNLTVFPSQISRLKKLQTLKLKGNKFSEDEKNKIRKALPNCIINF